MLTGRIDLSSNQSHVTNECPFCLHEWMDKVKPAGACPKCRRQYAMEQLPTGEVSIGWTMTNEEYELLKSGKI